MGIEYKATGGLQLAAVSIVAAHLYLTTFTQSVALVAVSYFIVKGVLFTLMKRNPLSLIDTLAGLYLILPVLGIFSNDIINTISLIFLAQKGIVYFFR